MKNESTKKVLDHALAAKLELELTQLQSNANAINSIRSKLYELMLNAYQVPSDHQLRANPKLHLSCTELESLLTHHGFTNSKHVSFH